MYWQDHDLVSPFEFMSDEAVIELDAIIGPVLAHYGMAIPPLPKFKVAQLQILILLTMRNFSPEIIVESEAAVRWLQGAYNLWPSGTKSKQITSWCDYNSGAIRSRIMYMIRLYRKTPGQSK